MNGAERFVAAANELQKQTLRAYAWTQEQSPALPLRDGAWIPHYPSQVHSPGKLAEFFPGQDGAWDKTHETGYFLHQTRTLLVQERGDDLWLLPFAPSEWLAHGRQVRVINAPTRFGPVSFTITSRASEGFAEVQADTSRLKVPGRVLVRLRGAEDSPSRSVLVNGKDRALKQGLAEVAP